MVKRFSHIHQSQADIVSESLHLRMKFEKFLEAGIFDELIGESEVELSDHEKDSARLLENTLDVMKNQSLQKKLPVFHSECCCVQERAGHGVYLREIFPPSVLDIALTILNS